MTKSLRPARLWAWAFPLALLCLGAAPLARADGAVDGSTIICGPCSSGAGGFGPIGAQSSIYASCTISGSVESERTVAGYLPVELYEIESESWDDGTAVESNADLYGIYFDIMLSAGGAADCSGSDTGTTTDLEEDYGGTETDSAYYSF